jgi:hypothetical protein
MYVLITKLQNTKNKRYIQVICSDVNGIKSDSNKRYIIWKISDYLGAKGHTVNNTSLKRKIKRRTGKYS